MIAKMVPGLNVSDVVGGSFCPTDGFINPLGVLEGFMKRAIENGTNVLRETEVFKINVQNGKVESIETNRGRIETETVVVCAGAWSKPIAATAGVELPVEPLRRQIVWARSSRDLPENLPMTIDLATGFHFRPAANSRRELLFAYPDREEKPSLRIDFEESFVDKVYLQARKRAPFLLDTEIVREKCRAGLYEMSPDHHAILGGCDVEGLYFATGFSGHGVMHSPATGKALAEIILDGKASFLDVSSLALERFAQGKLLHETAFI
jgi:sarcosine oxidase subunit beta